MDNAEPARVTLLGEQHAVVLPDFATREEIAVAYVDAQKAPPNVQLRALSAAIGLCTRIGRRAGADYAAHNFRVLAYGGEVYSHLRTAGATPAQIAEAATAIMRLVTDGLWPRRAEVQAELGNSGGGAGPGTAPPSP